MIKVYGVEIDKAPEGYNIQNLSEAQKLSLIENGDVEVYTLEGWFYYLNEDMIDTENMFWFTYNSELVTT